MNRLSLATTAAAVAGAVAISLAGAGVASATGVIIGPVHPQIDTLIGGTHANLGSTGGVVRNPGLIAAGDVDPGKIPHPII